MNTTINYLPEDAKIYKGEYLWWMKKGLTYTKSGYGSKIPTEYKVKWNGRTYRVYCIIYSNTGSYYIISNKQRYYIHEYNIPTK